MANVFDKYNFGTQSNNYNNRQRKQEEAGYLDALMRGGKANLQGVAGGLGYLFGAEQFANNMQRNAQENARKREHDTVFSLDYITDPEGLAYDVGGNLGSMVALAPFAMAVPAGVATAGAGAIGAGLGRLGLSKGAQWALSEAGKKALATGIRGAGAGVGESLAEWGSTAQEAQAQGAENPRLDTMGVFGQNLLVNPVSSGLEYMLLGGKLFNPTAKAGETFATRAVKAPMRALPAGGANAIQNGIEEVTQQTISDKALGLPVGDIYNPSTWTDSQRQAFEVGFASGGALAGVSSTGRALMPDTKGEKALKEQRAQEQAKQEAIAEQNKNIDEYINELDNPKRDYTNEYLADLENKQGQGVYIPERKEQPIQQSLGALSKQQPVTASDEVRDKIRNMSSLSNAQLVAEMQKTNDAVYSQALLSEAKRRGLNVGEGFNFTNPANIVPMSTIRQEEGEKQRQQTSSVTHDADNLLLQASMEQPKMQKPQRGLSIVNRGEVGSVNQEQKEYAELPTTEGKYLRNYEQELVNKYIGNPQLFEKDYFSAQNAVKRAFKNGDLTQDQAKAYLDNLRGLYDRTAQAIRNNGVIRQTGIKKPRNIKNIISEARQKQKNEMGKIAKAVNDVKLRNRLESGVKTQIQVPYYIQNAVKEVQEIKKAKADEQRKQQVFDEMKRGATEYINSIEPEARTEVIEASLEEARNGRRELFTPLVNQLKAGMGQGVTRQYVDKETGEVADVSDLKGKEETSKNSASYNREWYSNNDPWYQNWYRANGRKPTNAELYEIAENIYLGNDEYGSNLAGYDGSKESDEVLAQSKANVEYFDNLIKIYEEMGVQNTTETTTKQEEATTETPSETAQEAPQQEQKAEPKEVVEAEEKEPKRQKDASLEEASKEYDAIWDKYDEDNLIKNQLERDAISSEYTIADLVSDMEERLRSNYGDSSWREDDRDSKEFKAEHKAVKDFVKKWKSYTKLAEPMPTSVSDGELANLKNEFEDGFAKAVGQFVLDTRGIFKNNEYRHHYVHRDDLGRLNNNQKVRMVFVSKTEDGNFVVHATEMHIAKDGQTFETTLDYNTKALKDWQAVEAEVVEVEKAFLNQPPIWKAKWLNGGTPINQLETQLTKPMPKTSLKESPKQLSDKVKRMAEMDLVKGDTIIPIQFGKKWANNKYLLQFASENAEEAFDILGGNAILIDDIETGASENLDLLAKHGFTLQERNQNQENVSNAKEEASKELPKLEQQLKDLTNKANSNVASETTQKEYKYYMNHRPISIGAVPDGFTRFDEDDKGGRYGAIYYDKPLSDEDVKNYELKSAREDNPNQSGITFNLNSEKNGIEIKFDKRPSADVLKALKGGGYRWSSQQQLWWASQNNEKAMKLAKSLGFDAQSEVKLDNDTKQGGKDNVVYNAEELSRNDNGNRRNQDDVRGTAESERTSGNDGQRSGTTGATGERNNGNNGVSRSGDSVSGERTADKGKNEEPATGKTAPRSADRGRSLDDSETRQSDVEQRGTETIIESVADRQVNATQEQLKENTVPNEKAGRKQKIAKSMPFLTTLQVNNTEFAHVRLNDKKEQGVMFTDGTGTGKTFSGLAIIQEALKDGKKNILIVSPSNTINNQWVKSAKDFFVDGDNKPINIHELKDVKDGGKGVCITTYANIRANEAIVNKEWDLVVCDEAHNLMSNEKGNATTELNKVRMITYHNRGLYDRATVLVPDTEKLQQLRQERETLDEKLENARSYDERKQLSQQIDAKAKEVREEASKISDKRKELIDEWKQIPKADKPKVVFLTATPFAYDKDIDYAEGYLFDYPEVESGGYNQPNGYQKFMIDHFGYSMSYNKLTRPDAEVDNRVMEVNFHNWLRKNGALEGHELEVDYDYNRGFILVGQGVGAKIDEGFEFLNNNRTKYSQLIGALDQQFDARKRQYLLESIKAQQSIKLIKDYLKAGKKVVVFHDTIQAREMENPFVITDDLLGSLPPDLRRRVKSEYEMLRAERPDLFKLPMKNLKSPLEILDNAFGKDAMYFNGKVSKKQRELNKAHFNNDNSGKNLIIVQKDAGNAGISLHDTTGKHQRVAIFLGTPTRPTYAIQMEGRIYRTGNKSNAIFRYLTTGTNMENYIFATTIAGRASTAENLAMGDKARGLRDSFINAYAEVLDGTWEKNLPNMEGEDIGGKEADRSIQNEISEFERAKSFYYANQKKNSKTKEAEGIDYYATPEPVGFKMVEWAGLKAGDKVLEPSAGHGAISRFFDPNTENTIIEPSDKLASVAVMNTDNAKLIQSTFESHNVINKYDAVIMNPPFGTAGKTAMEHVAKAFKHLRNNGRLIALVPRGKMDERFDKWYESEEAKHAYKVAEIELPAVTFKRAGTAVGTRILIIDKHETKEPLTGIYGKHIDLRSADNISELFDRIENIEMPAREQYTYDGRNFGTIGERKYSPLDNPAYQRSLEEIYNDLNDIFEGAKVEELGNEEWRVTTPNGKRIIVKVADRIILNDKQSASMRKAHNLDSDYIAEASGYWRAIGENDVDGELVISRNSKKGTAYHEILHAVMDLALTAKEKRALIKDAMKEAKETGKDVEEVIAERYRKWVLARKRGQGTAWGKLFKKMQDFYYKLKALFTRIENAHNVMRKIESGEVWNREAKPLYSKNLAPKFMVSEDKISKFISAVLRNPQEKLVLTLGKVSEAEAKAIKEATGFDVEGFNHVWLDEDVRHIQNNHGEGNEKQKNAIGLTQEDMREALKAIEAPDKIEKAPRKEPSIRFIKTMDDGTYTVVEVVRQKKKRLAIKTMWKNVTKNKETATTTPRVKYDPQYTSEADSGQTVSLRSNGYAFDDSVAQGQDEVKYSEAPTKNNINSIVISTEPSSFSKDIKEQGIKGWLQEKAKNFYRDWVDKNDALHEYDNAIEKATGRKLTDGEKIYNKAQMMNATATGMANALIEGDEQHIKSLSKRLGRELHNVTLKKILEFISNDKMNKLFPNYLKENGYKDWVDAFGHYLAFRRLREMKRLYGDEYKLPKGVTIQDIEKAIQNAPAPFKKASEMYYDLNDNMLTILEDAGIISKEVHKLLNDKYKEYCPLMRDFSDTAGADMFLQGLSNGGRGIANVSSTLKRISLEGSERGVINPLETTFKAVAVMANRAERNKVGQLAVSYANLQGMENIIRHIPTPKGGNAVADPKNSIFTVMIDGKKEAYQVIPELYSPIVGYNVPTAGFVLGVARDTARMLRTGATISPSFVIRNFIRDTIFASISSQNGFIPIVDSVKGAYALLHDAEMRAEFEVAGVTAFNFYKNAETAYKSLVELNGGKEINFYNPIDVIKALAKYPEEFSAFVESATRMGEFKRAREAGKSIDEATRDARELTIDFSRSGVLGENVNLVVPFFNATIQGGDKLYRLFRDNPVGTAVNVAKYIVLPSMVLWAMNYDDEEYKELDPKIKMTHWIIGDVRIPKPQEAGILFGSGIEAMLDLATGNDKEAMKHWAKQVVDGVSPNIIPTVILPLIEWQANYSFFRDGKLVGYREEKLPDELQYKDSTSELSKDLGKLTGLSPIKLDNTVRGYTGTMGMLLWQAYDIGSMDKAKLPEKKITELPLIRDFFVNEYNARRSVDDFYKLAEQADKQHAGYGVKGKPTAVVQGIRRAKQQISNINKDIRNISSSTLTPSEKRERIDKKREIMHRIAKQANDRYGKFFE